MSTLDVGGVDDEIETGVITPLGCPQLVRRRKRATLRFAIHTSSNRSGGGFRSRNTSRWVLVAPVASRNICALLKAIVAQARIGVASRTGRPSAAKGSRHWRQV